MKRNIALLTGGYSCEAEISYQSVITVKKINTDSTNTVITTSRFTKKDFCVINLNTVMIIKFNFK